MLLFNHVYQSSSFARHINSHLSGHQIFMLDFPAQEGTVGCHFLVYGCKDARW